MLDLIVSYVDHPGHPCGREIVPFVTNIAREVQCGRNCKHCGRSYCFGRFRVGGHSNINRASATINSTVYVSVCDYNIFSAL